MSASMLLILIQLHITAASRSESNSLPACAEEEPCKQTHAEQASSQGWQAANKNGQKHEP